MAYSTDGMRMPTNYVDMSATDMQFDGSWSWGKFWNAMAFVGAAVMVAGIVTLALATGGAAMVVGGCLMAGGMAMIGAGLSFQDHSTQNSAF